MLRKLIAWILMGPKLYREWTWLLVRRQQGGNDGK